MIKTAFSSLKKYQYSLLLISSLLMMLNLPHWGDDKVRDFILGIIFVFNVLTGMVLLHGNRSWWNRALFVIGTALIFVRLLDWAGAYSMIDAYPTMYILFFVSISTKVYKDIYKAVQIDREMLAAVAAGFILLGIQTTFLFLTLESAFPGSISEAGTDSYESLVYFSFITLLTIGYGDITPISEVARSMTLIIGIIGHFYTAIVTGIIIGKYLKD